MTLTKKYTLWTNIEKREGFFFFFFKSIKTTIIIIILQFIKLFPQVHKTI